jgi:hypothetical protein
MDQNSAFEIVGTSTTDDNWTLDSGGNIAFINSGAVQAQTFTADANGNITSGAGALDINTSPLAGIIDLDAGGGIGTQLNPLAVSAWPAPVRAVGQTGDVYLTSPGPLLVDQASAGGADPDVSLVTTGTLSQLIASLPSLGNDQWHLEATGDIRLDVTAEPGGIQWSQIEDLNSSGVDRSIFVSTDLGPMLVNTVYSGVVTADDNLTVYAASGNIEFTNAALLTAANANLYAINGSILATGNTTRVDITTGELLFFAGNATGTIGSAGAAFVFSAPRMESFASAAQWLIAADPTRVLRAQTANAGGSISLVQGTFYLAADPLLPPNTPSFETTMLLVEQGAHLGGDGGVQGTLHVLSGGLVSMGFGSDQAGLIRVQRQYCVRQRLGVDRRYQLTVHYSWARLRPRAGHRQRDARQLDAHTTRRLRIYGSRSTR